MRPPSRSNAAPTPNIVHGMASACAAIHFSCFGQPIPTSSSCAPLSRIRRVYRSSSSGVGGLNGGSIAQASCRRGYSRASQSQNTRRVSGEPP